MLGNDPGGLGGDGGTGDGGGGTGEGTGEGTGMGPGTGLGGGTGPEFLMPHVHPSLELGEEFSLVKKHFPLAW